ncbi:MAG TPA: iron ABC transporter, partial [Planctomycetaceae bacterium]|nr:iron ABC transporter [Planctomycetaceae bacterium]
MLSLAAFPNWEELQRVLLLTDYNTRIVIIGTTLLGAAAGMVGSFTLLRKRSLMGDALSHATLPGIALAFIIAPTFGLDGKSMGVLLFGATLSGLLGVVVILAIRSQTRLKEDTALGAVLSVFFGAGVALLGVIQKMNQGHAAGLESFILGKTATMSSTDLQLIFVAGAICVGSCILCFKELKLLCFDDVYAGSRGYRV